MRQTPCFAELIRAMLGCCVLLGVQVHAQQGGCADCEFSVTGGSWPAVADLADGGFVICWQAQGSDSPGWEVHCQRFAADGTASGPPLRVNTSRSERHTEPAVASFADGGFVVCWNHYQPSEDRTDVWAQRFSANGQRLGPEFRVNSHTPGFQQRAAVASLRDGGFVVCWQSQDQDGWEDGVFAQRFAADGSRMGTEFQVHTSVEGDEELVQVVPSSDGGFAASWHRSWATDTRESREDILCQQFDSLGNRLGAETKVTGADVAPFARPSLSSLRDGGVVVCWARAPYQYWQDIRARHVSPGGTTLGPEFVVNTPAPDLWNLEPCVTMLRNGDLLFCWRHWPRPGSDGRSKCDIFARRVAADGSPKGPEFRVNGRSEFGLLHNFPVLAPFADSGFVACWQTGSGGIKARCFASDPPPVTSDTVSVFKEAHPEGNFPNPFNSSTRIRFLLPDEGKERHVRLKVYDLLGCEIATLVDGVLHPGEHSVLWDGLDACGTPVASGVYVYLIERGGLRTSRRMVLLR
ncbi:MAG: hypothetical protein H5U38_02085 [Calditrichaeota bacterium]|nr:hypothetical protein [Calditrichota bacterium]